jgi:hypothetical protein
MAEPLPLSTKRTIWRGDTRTWTHVFEDVAEDGTTTPRDMSGHTWLGQWRADDKRGEVIAVSSFDTSDAESGVIVETLTATEADKMPVDAPAGSRPGTPPTVYWDMQSTVGGVVRTWFYSNATVKGDRSDD